MAITFIEERKKQKYLIFIFIGILLVIFIVIWQGFLKKEKPVFIEEKKERAMIFEKIKINFEVLDNPILKELQPFEKIPSFEGEKGRKNPFLPY